MIKTRNYYEVALYGATSLPFKRGIEVAVAATIGAIASISAATISAGAGVVGTAMTNSANAKAVESTNNANLQSVRETNAMNAQNVENTNATNLAIANANNNRQVQLQREMNKYNSLSEQIKRAREAGVNPNAILNGSVSGNLQTTLPQLTTPTLQAPLMEAFKALAPHFENPTAEFSNNFERIMTGVSQLRANLADGKLKDALGDYQKVVNNYIDEKQKLGIQIDKASLNKFVAESSKAWQEMQVAKVTVNQVQAMVRSIDLDNYDKMMRNVFSKDFYETGVRLAKSMCDVNENQAHIMMKMLPLQMGLIKAQTRSANASAWYAEEMAKLAPAQRELLQRQSYFIDAQTYSQWLDNNLKSETFDATSSKARAEAKSAWKDYENKTFENTPIMKFSRWFNTMVGGVAQGVSTGVSVGMSMRGAKGSPAPTGKYYAPSEQSSTLDTSKLDMYGSREWW